MTRKRWKTGNLYTYSWTWWVCHSLLYFIRLTFVTLSGVDLKCVEWGGWGKFREKKYVLNTQEFHKHAILALPPFSPSPFFSSFFLASFYIFYLTSIYRGVSPETPPWKHKWIVLSYIFIFCLCWCRLMNNHHVLIIMILIPLQIVQESPYLTMDLLESCFPYALLRNAYHTVYKASAMDS